MLKIAIYDGDFFGDMSELAHVCDFEGSVTPDDRPPFMPLEETLRMLAMYAKRYSVPRLLGPCFTVFIQRITGAEAITVVRLDGYARDGQVSAHVIGLPPDWTTEPVRYEPDDDAVEVVRKLLAAQFPQ
ncbi:hypothetical protein [Paraburkholderia sp. HP33-1]|uniref:hypothetical protein n=1 Tax=Paraburkholderia sp. HP33-1 TaxID=2883243 RepID=UPI001F26A5E9|nr:hypothetical protein [Paraburkholderia sp. HP33-1]